MIFPEFGSPIFFQWNPKSLRRNKSNKWSRLKVAGREQPILQFGCGDAQAYEFELHLTVGFKGQSNVTNSIDQLIDLTIPMPFGSGSVYRPPRVVLILGAAIETECIVESVAAVYDQPFHPATLHPRQGKAKIKLVEYK